MPAPFAVLVVRGPDAVDFLHRLCSQDIAGMLPGKAAPAAFLSGKGKLIATCDAGRTPEAVWLEVTADQCAALAATLERYHFTERLEIAQPSDLVCGEVVGHGVPERLGLEPWTCALLDGGGVVFAGARHGVSWARYYAPSGFFAPAPPWARLGLSPLSDERAEVLRICAGVVRVGADTEAGTLALEADLDDHVSTTKGCYTGQEIVARIGTYGHVNRRLRLVEISGAAAVPIGTTLVEPTDGDAVGRVMTTAVLPDGQRRVGLAYLPRDFWDAGTRLRLGDAAGVDVQVVGFAPA